MKKTVMLLVLVWTIISCNSSSQPADRHLKDGDANGTSLTIDSFLKDRNAVGKFLSSSFTVLPEGASLTELSSKKKAFDGTFPGDSHIRSVVKRQQWTGHSGYFFTLKLSDTLLSSYDQNNSETMAATYLLNHFFGGLSSFGFRNMGSPGVLSEQPIQYACNTWFKDPGSNISIFGSVYVDLESETALVDLKISEYYDQLPGN